VISSILCLNTIIIIIKTSAVYYAYQNVGFNNNNNNIILRRIENVNVAQSKVYNLLLNYTIFNYTYELKLKSVLVLINTTNYKLLNRASH
jgi:hypothetical protein